MSDGTVTNDVDTREILDLSQPEGLVAFLTSVREAYEAVCLFENEARAENYARLTVSGIQGREIFLTLHELWGDLLHNVRKNQMIVEMRGDLSEQVVLNLQRQYDDFLVLRNHILTVYTNDVPLTAKVIEVAEKREQGKRTGFSGGTKEIDTTDAVVALYVEIEALIAETERRLQTSKARVINQVSTSKGVKSDHGSVDELEQLQDKIKTLKDRIAKSKETVRDESVLKQVKDKYIAILQQITDRTVAIEEEIRQHFQSVTTGMVVSPASAEALESAAVETHSLKSTPESIRTAADQLLWEVRYQPFYTPVEQRMAEDLHRSVQESIALDRSPSFCEEDLAVLAQFVTSLKKAPQIAELSGRVHRIMRRITAMLPFNSDTLRTARMLERKFKDVVADSTCSTEEKIEAYNMLDTYVMSHEAEWLMVCGVAIPAPGETGVSQAREMREALLVERDRNQAFIKNPHKQVLVDKLIRKLSFIPPAGFEEETDLDQIKKLVRAIDVSGQQVNHHAVATNEEETSIESLGVQKPQHHQLRINGEDDTANLSITVALRASKRSEAHRSKQSVVETAAMSSAQLIETAPERAESAFVARLERQDPVTTTIPSLTPKFFPSTPVHEKRSLIKLYLHNQLYYDFINQHYTSEAAFERVLETIITQVESKTTDIFERWLGEEKASAFQFMEELTITSVLELASNPHVRDILSEQNIKYETYLSWIDLIDEMQAVVGDDFTLCFGELYTRWIIESEIIFAQGTAGV